jgi:hypothetical protein
MIWFFLCVGLLIAGYFIYGKFIERIFGPKPELKTPAITMADGVDYVPMSDKKVYLVQLLNIAGVGPIFGPILGALYGPVAMLWIVFGCIFAGAVHDYFSGMLSVRARGASVPTVVGEIVVDRTGEDADKDDPEHGDRTIEGTQDGAEDGADAGDVEQLNQVDLLVRHGDIVHPVRHGDGGGLQLGFGPEYPFDEFAVYEVAGYQQADTEEEPDHCYAPALLFFGVRSQCRGGLLLTAGERG